VAEQLGDRIDLIIDGGECSVGLESTILDLTAEKPKILRHGCVSAEQISDCLKISVAELINKDSTSSKEIKAPGMLKEHYAPRTKLKLISTGDLQQSISGRTALVYMNQAMPPTELKCFSETRFLSQTGDFDEIARNLFKTLRELDALGLDLILIEGCSSDGIGRAIMDRLYRASARWSYSETN
jgi:L-threonylcarbamoyladenylate synthase